MKYVLIRKMNPNVRKNQGDCVALQHYYCKDEKIGKHTAINTATLEGLRTS